jgi:hypothetical protein
MFIDILCLLSNSDLVDSMSTLCLFDYTAIFKISDCCSNVQWQDILGSGFLFFFAIFFIYWNCYSILFSENEIISVFKFLFNESKV